MGAGRAAPIVSGRFRLCHVTEGWDVLRKDFSFDHEKVTGYPLQAHAEAACLRCHNDRGPVQFYARGCGGCHPDPHTSSLGLNCERCHGQPNWRPTGLIAEHARTRSPCSAPTPWRLVRLSSGAPAGQFRGLRSSAICAIGPTWPGHVPGPCRERVGTVASVATLPLGWDRAFVRHDFFSLSSGHAGLDCTRCHTSGVLGKIPSDCYSCHAANYQTAPGHVASNFPHTCQQCHSITGWLPAHYDHTAFPLTAARQSGLHPVSHERHVRTASHGLLFLPRRELSECPEPRGPRFSADVPAVPYDDGLEPVDVPPHVPTVGSAQSVLYDVSYRWQHQHFQLSELSYGGEHERASQRRVQVQLQLTGMLPMSSDGARGLRQP